MGTSVMSNGKRAATFRFAIGAGNLRLSSIWSAKANKCDLYIGVRSLMGSLKLSIHGADDYRRCHIALTDRYWDQASEKISPPMESRDFAVWDMPPISEKGANEVVSIWLPRNHYRKSEQVTLNPKKPICFLPPAPPDSSVRLRFLESREAVVSLLPKLQLLGRPVGNFQFDDGRNIAMTMSIETFDAALLESVRQGQGHGTIFNKEAAPATGQTISDLSAIAWTEPADGQAIHLAELNGISLRRS